MREGECHASSNPRQNLFRKRTFRTCLPPSLHTSSTLHSPPNPHFFHLPPSLPRPLLAYPHHTTSSIHSQRKDSHPPAYRETTIVHDSIRQTAKSEIDISHLIQILHFFFGVATRPPASSLLELYSPANCFAFVPFHVGPMTGRPTQQHHRKTNNTTSTDRQNRQNSYLVDHRLSRHRIEALTPISTPVRGGGKNSLS